jgi:ABC-type polysaccharide/polyol phosphate export permease
MVVGGRTGLSWGRESALRVRFEDWERFIQAEAKWIENRPSKGFRRLDLRELWEYRELAGFLALRDLKARYKQAVFGFSWALIQPLAGVAIFTVVFRRLADMPSDGIPYPLFAYVGLSVWAYFAGAVSKATESLVHNAALVTKIYFPRVLAPAAAVLPGLVDMLLALLLLIVLIPVFGVAPSWAMLTAPLWVLPLVGTALGTGLWMGALNVSYRDIGQAIGLVVQLWLFASPIAYPSSAVPEQWQTLYFLNPMAGVIEGFRWALIGGPWPGPRLWLSFTVMALLVAAGMLYFLRLERRFADVI